MALPALGLQFLKAALDYLDESPHTNRKAISLGYPDILATESEIAGIFGERIAEGLKYREDSGAIARWHGQGGKLQDMVDAEHFFSLLGYELEVVDIVAARGGEILLDLNKPIPEHLHQRYILAMDGGTLEHCFNIAQAMKNLAAMVALGGVVYQSNPFSQPNHGFYNLNPTFYYDFYELNGFAVSFFRMISTTPSLQVMEVPAHTKFRGVPEGSANLVLAKRIEVRDIVYPVQTIYRANPTLRG